MQWWLGTKVKPQSGEWLGGDRTMMKLEGHMMKGIKNCYNNRFSNMIAILIRISKHSDFP